MYRYYISFSCQAPTGFAIATGDIDRPTRITSVDDVNSVRDYYTNQGYANVTVLAFSLYAPAHSNKPDRADRGNRGRNR